MKTAVKKETTDAVAEQQPEKIEAAALISNSSIQAVEDYLSKKYDFRKNLVTEMIEFGNKGSKNYVAMKDRDYNSLYRELQKSGNKIAASNLRSLLNSDFVAPYDPFKDYFVSLPEWDTKTDYIKQLAETVKTTNDAFWHECFKRWIVALVGCAIEERVTNHTVIVFAGKQGLGKTTWHLNLVPDPLKDYRISDTLNPKNKDSIISLSECILINLDELESLNKSELGDLKEMITKSAIRIRRTYGYNHEKMIRRASFTGSVNQATFLNDTTGSRRFLCFTVTEIDYISKIDLNLVYAQALYLFRSNFKYWFDSDETQKVEQNNEKYQQATFEEELLLKFFKPGTATAGAFLTTSEIAQMISKEAKFPITDSTIRKLGQALKKSGFPRMKKGDLYKYSVSPATAN